MGLAKFGGMPLKRFRGPRVMSAIAATPTDWLWKPRESVEREFEQRQELTHRLCVFARGYRLVGHPSARAKNPTARDANSDSPVFRSDPAEVLPIPYRNLGT